MGQEEVEEGLESVLWVGLWKVCIHPAKACNTALSVCQGHDWGFVCFLAMPCCMQGPIPQ